MSVEKRLEEIIKRAKTALKVTSEAVLNAKAEPNGKHYISLGGELDSIILCAEDALGAIDALKGEYDETTNP